MSALSNILDVVRKGVEFAEGLAPAISLIPGAGPILATAVSAAGAIQEVVANIQTRITEGHVVATSQEEAEIRGYAERLSAINDQLASEIDES